jgi:hypothetical protein
MPFSVQFSYFGAIKKAVYAKGLLSEALSHTRLKLTVMENAGLMPF